jgi:hypothetical protein
MLPNNPLHRIPLCLHAITTNLSPQRANKNVQLRRQWKKLQSCLKVKTHATFLRNLNASFMLTGSRWIFRNTNCPMARCPLRPCFQLQSELIKQDGKYQVANFGVFKKNFL